MKIILTGGTGLIGRELGKALVKQGHEIVVLTREPKSSRLKTPYPHKPIYWDGESEALASESFDGVDGIVHLAGVGIAEKRWSKSFKQRLEDSRILATKNLLKNAPKNIQFFIGSSAIGFYPEDSIANQAMKEETSAADHFFGQLCKQWEASAYEMLDQKQTRICHIRTGVVLSPQGGALAQMIPPLRTGLAGPLGNGQQIMSWVDIDDIVGIYLLAIENEKLKGPINGVAPHPVTNKKLTQLIGKRISRPVISPVPKISLRLVLGEFAKYLVMSQKISGEKIISFGYKFKFSDVESSLEKNIPKHKFSETRFLSEQYVDQPLEKVFEFFSNADNLEKITPPSLQFKILSKSTDKIQVGTIINYKLKLDGILPLHWQTLITGWNPPYEFTDYQKKGPYKKWNHTHTFEKLGSGVLMKDQVDYILPLSALGSIFAGWKVRRDISKIFNFRTQVLDQIF
jgi:uncharacterized protein